MEISRQHVLVKTDNCVYFSGSVKEIEIGLWVKRTHLHTMFKEKELPHSV